MRSVSEIRRRVHGERQIAGVVAGRRWDNVLCVETTLLKAKVCTYQGKGRQFSRISGRRHKGAQEAGKQGVGLHRASACG